MRFRYLLYGWMSLLLVSCTQDVNQDQKVSNELDKVLHKISPKHSGLDFANELKEDKNFNHLVWESVFYGGGVASGDVNNDGLIDLFFTGNQVPNKLYLNQGGLKFKDVSEESGIIPIKNKWSTGVTMADVNNDGWLDIYVCSSWYAEDEEITDQTRNLLYINNKKGAFVEQGQAYGIADIGHSSQASFADFDQDGDLDLYIMNTPSNNVKQKLVYIKENKIPYQHSDKLYRNDQGIFTDVTKVAGIEHYAFGLGLITLDFNNDGWTDIYVANDFEKADRMLINQKDGTFKNEINQRLKHISYSSMGCDVADINNDAYAELFVLDMQSSDHYRSKTSMPSMSSENFWKNVLRGEHHQYMSNMLQLNNGDGFYSEIAHMAGVNSTDWSWSSLFLDVDNDGFKDLFITNGVDRDLKNNDYLEMLKAKQSKPNPDLLALAKAAPSKKIRNFLFSNKGKLQFKDRAQEFGIHDLGFSYGASYADLDKDGDMELIVCNNNAPVSIYENKSEQRSISFDLHELPNMGMNTKVQIWYSGLTQVSEYTATRGYQSSVSSMLQFGLNDHQFVDSVHFTQGDRFKSLPKLSADSIYNIQFLDEHRSAKVNSQKTFFEMATSNYGFNYIHEEDRFDDFQTQLLLPHRQSRRGPAILNADLNNDGREDIFIGGAANDADIIYIQNRLGQFDVHQILKEEQQYETVDVASIDLNNDGYLDLYVVDGGAHKPKGDLAYTDRVYMNNKNGSFTYDPSRLQARVTNGSSVEVGDLDGDGDSDVFVGGHIDFGRYPINDASVLLINEEGVLIDHSKENANSFLSIGLVDDVVFSDVDQDGDLDILPVGEWNHLQYWENDGNAKFNGPLAIIEEQTKGMWKSIHAVDLNKDGKDDYVLGNLGLNNKYRPKNDQPLKLYANDFDKNSSFDVVLAKPFNGNYVPVRGKECTSEKMPFVSRKFKDYHSFASASLMDIYGSKSLESSNQFESYVFENGVLLSSKSGYDFVSFPINAQIAPVLDVVAIDVDGDDLEDLIVGGNIFDAEVETVRHDASNGHVLLNKKDHFEYVYPKKTGLEIASNVKHISIINIGKERFLLVGNNNNVQQFVKFN